MVSPSRSAERLRSASSSRKSSITARKSETAASTVAESIYLDSEMATHINIHHSRQHWMLTKTDRRSWQFQTFFSVISFEESCHRSLPARGSRKPMTGSRITWSSRPTTPALPSVSTRRWARPNWPTSWREHSVATTGTATGSKPGIRT